MNAFLKTKKTRLTSTDGGTDIPVLILARHSWYEIDDNWQVNLDQAAKNCHKKADFFVSFRKVSEDFASIGCFIEYDQSSYD